MTLTENGNDFPSSEYRFFVYDPADRGFRYFRTAAERDAYAEDLISNYLDDSWDEDVEHIIAGWVTHTCGQTDRRDRPDDSELDDDGIDGEGVYWPPDIDYMCQYELAAIALPQDDEATLRAIVAALHPEWNEHRQPVGFDEARRVLAAVRGALAQPPG